MLRLSVPALVLFSLLACNSETPFDPISDDSQFARPPELEPQANVDLIVQTTIPVVDILYVIDNSCSMADKQAQLSQNFPRFMQYFVDSGLDFHIGVVSTDMDYNGVGNKGIMVNPPNATAGRFIDNGHPNPVGAFSNMALLGINGSGTERGRAPAYTALEIRRNTQNTGFVRDNSVQHIIFVSDEPDQSFGNPVTKPEFMNWMRGFKAVPDLTVAHAIVGLPGGGGTPACYSEVDPNYIDYANQTGGVKFNICAPAAQWGGFLEELGLQASGLQREFFLSQLPIPDSIEVIVHTIDEDTEQPVSFVFHQDPDRAPLFRFEYNQARNSVTMVEYLPKSFAEIEVKYRLLASGQSFDETN